jgi:hypothetical protein
LEKVNIEKLIAKDIIHVKDIIKNIIKAKKI